MASLFNILTLPTRPLAARSLLWPTAVVFANCFFVISCAAGPTAETGLAEHKNRVSIAEVQQRALEWALQSGHYRDHKQRIEIKPGKADPRLSFSRCAIPLSFEPQKSGNRSSRSLVKVRCQDSHPWGIFVPLEITRFKHVAVLNKTIMRGQRVSSEDVALQEVRLTRPTDNLFEQVGDVEGLIAKRTLAAGYALSELDVKQPKLVKRGDDVVIVATSGSVTVKMQGTALADGYRNQQVTVKNKRSQRTIKAIVTDPGQVQAIM